MKRHTAVEVTAKPGQAETDLAQGLSLAQVCQRRGASEPTRHRWRHQYGGLKQGEEIVTGPAKTLRFLQDGDRVAASEKSTASAAVAANP